MNIARMHKREKELLPLLRMMAVKMLVNIHLCRLLICEHLHCKEKYKVFFKIYFQ